jgi:hypothetical protein
MRYVMKNSSLLRSALIFAACHILISTSISTPLLAMDELNDAPIVMAKSAPITTVEEEILIAQSSNTLKEVENAPIMMAAKDASVEALPLNNQTEDVKQESFPQISKSINALPSIFTGDYATQDELRAETNGSYVEPVGDTHPVLNLTPDKSTIIRLERPAASIIVGNDAHVNIMADTPTTLIAIPRKPGASSVTILDAKSRVIMRRHIIVGPAQQYVRVRRSCAGQTGCAHTSVFFCPQGMCHQIDTQQEAQPAQAQTDLGAGSTQTAQSNEAPYSAPGNEPSFNDQENSSDALNEALTID